MTQEGVIIVVAVIASLVVIATVTFVVLAAVGARWREVCEDCALDDVAEVDA